MAERHWKRFEVGLTTEVGSGVSALDWADGEGGGEGGGGGDGGGGDPVEQELALPVHAQLLGGPNTLRQLRRLDIWLIQLCSIKADCPPFSPRAGSQGSWWYIAHWSSWNSRGGRACADKEQLWVSLDLLGAPARETNVGRLEKVKQENLLCSSQEEDHQKTDSAHPDLWLWRM